MSKSLLLLAILLLAGCASKSDPWNQDAVKAETSRFDSKRLSYMPLSGHPPWRIDIVQMDGEPDVFISLIQHQFHPIPGSRQIKVVLHLGEKTLEDLSPLFQGNMKLQLSPTLSKTLIQSLQEGQKVSILINEWEETISSSSFEKNFAKFMNPSYLDWLNIQTPLK